MHCLLLGGLLSGLAGGEVLLDALLAGLEVLGGELLVGLGELLELASNIGDGGLLVLGGEDLTGPVSAGTLGDAELVTLEVGGVGKGSLGGEGAGELGLGELLEGLLLGEGSGDDLGGGVLGDGDGELDGGDVLQVLDVLPHLLVSGVLDEDAVSVDDVGDDADPVLTGTTDDAHEAANLDVGSSDHLV
eukprot:c9085_g1_i1.p1 GENE.c9085_g1_i1~~c9085_g1_i1.p1  ORF type:complete len:189 (-),score=-21.53 c9085_g1_i1:31-597(-)